MPFQPKITDQDKDFILANAATMKQVKIARTLNISEATVSRVIKSYSNANFSTQKHFNIDTFKKHYAY